jgi:hypothetical protein
MECESTRSAEPSFRIPDELFDENSSVRSVDAVEHFLFCRETFVVHSEPFRDFMQQVGISPGYRS